MKDFTHISKFESILDTHTKILDEIYTKLEELENLASKYSELVEYYYSDQRMSDLEADDKGQIPSSIKRGVLSEDEIYNMMISHRETAIKMLETATLMLKG